MAKKLSALTRLREGVTFDEYRAIEAVNWSSLKVMAESPAHYKWSLDHDRKATSAMGKGIAIHAAVLEPDSFPLRFVVWDGDRRGNAWKEFREANANRDVITRAEYDLCISVRDAVKADADASALLYGRSELVIEWEDEGTGLMCKARLDHVNADNEIVDLKMCPNTDVFQFERHSASMLYHGQLAFYRRGLAAVLKAVVPRPRIIAVEWDEPHDVTAFHLTDDALYAGEQHVDDLLTRLANCRRSDKWPGRYQGQQDLSIPEYLMLQAEPDGAW